MPCPPSYEEQESMRQHIEDEKERERLAVEEERIDQIRLVLKQLKNLLDKPLETPLDEQYKVFIQRKIIHTSYSEVHQCELRTLMMNIWNLIPNSIKDSHPIKTSFLEQKEFHLAHRKRDREETLEQLEKEVEKCKNDPLKQQSIKEKIRKILSFSEEELLCNRKLF